jgi:hypothetical protein
MATQEWHVLTNLTGGELFEIERVRLPSHDVAIEGRFELPPLARLTAEDQTFVAAFVRCHGSIKQMERYFGVSYPTVKNRLNRIGALLPFAEVEPEPADQIAKAELLSRLERGEISVKDVLDQLQPQKEGR